MCLVFFYPLPLQHFGTLDLKTKYMFLRYLQSCDRRKTGKSINNLWESDSLKSSWRWTHFNYRNRIIETTSLRRTPKWKISIFNSSKEAHTSCGWDHLSDKRILWRWTNTYKKPDRATGQLGLEYEKFKLKFDFYTTIMETNSVEKSIHELIRPPIWLENNKKIHDNKNLAGQTGLNWNCP